MIADACDLVGHVPTPVNCDRSQLWWLRDSPREAQYCVAGNHIEAWRSTSPSDFGVLAPRSAPVPALTESRVSATSLRRREPRAATPDERRTATPMNVPLLGLYLFVRQRAAPVLMRTPTLPARRTSPVPLARPRARAADAIDRFLERVADHVRESADPPAA